MDNGEGAPTDGAIPMCENWTVEDVVSDPGGGSPFGYLDTPAFEASVSGRVRFKGWALSPAGMDGVEVHIDGELFATLPLDAPRTDVCAAFPNTPCNPGFDVELDLFELTECDHQVEIVAIDGDGARAVVDRALLHVTRPPRGYRFGARENVHRIEDTRITQALDMIVTPEDEVIACFGSWHTPGNNYDSHCRNLMTGEEDRGHGQHETAGVGLDQGSAGVLIGFEADNARAHGGPGIFGDGLAHDDGGTHYWQSVSVGNGFAIAAAARIDGLFADVYIGENEGAGPWSLLTTSGRGVPHRQVFFEDRHLIFTTRYQSSGTPRLMRVDADRDLSTVTYSGLPNGCEGVGIAAHIPTVGLVAGTYSDQLPWRGGNCGAVGLLNADTGATSDWVSVQGADIIDVVPIGSEGFFAASVNFPARVLLFDPDFQLTDTVKLIGGQVGGLAFVNGALYAASAGNGIGAYVFRFPLAFNPEGPALQPEGPAATEPGPPAANDRDLCLIWRQTEQACDGCGIWFDWEHAQANKPRLVVEYILDGQTHTRVWQHGNAEAGDAAALTLLPNGSVMEHAMLIKQTPARHGLFWADLSDLDENAQIQSATLRLHIESAEGLANSDNSSVIQAHACGQPFDPDTVNWNQARAGQPWTTPGGDFGPLVHAFSAGADMHGRGYSKANPNIPFDFSGHVQGLFGQ
jgi:hypothetical protein